MSAWLLVGVSLLLAWPVQNAVMALFAWWRPRPAVPAGRTATPRFWLVIPALNEELVVAATVRAALLPALRRE